MDNTLTAGATVNLGALGGVNTAVLGPGNESAGTTTWCVGWANTTNTFAGTIEDDTPGGGHTSITKVGTGIWYLSGQNTYTGSTVVSNGVLALTNNMSPSQDGSIDNSTNIYIYTGATFDVPGSEISHGTLSSGQFIGGGGTVNGAISAGSGHLYPLRAARTGSGTLTVNGALSEYGGTPKLLLSSPGGTNDLIQVQGNLNTVRRQYTSGGRLWRRNDSRWHLPVDQLHRHLEQQFRHCGLHGGIVGRFPDSFSPITSSAHDISLVVSPLAPRGDQCGLGGRQLVQLLGHHQSQLEHWRRLGNTFEFGDSVIFTDTRQRQSGRDLERASVPGRRGGEQLGGRGYTFAGTGGIDGATGSGQDQQRHPDHSEQQHLHRTDRDGRRHALHRAVALGGLPSPIGAAGNNSTNWCLRAAPWPTPVRRHHRPRHDA